MDSSRFRSVTPRPELLTRRTVLDPLSLIDEEDQSLNKQLMLIHKEYDKIKSENRKKQSLILTLKKDITTAKTSSNSISDDKSAVDTRVQQLEHYLESVMFKRKEEESFLKSYQYLLDRIKEDKHSLDKELKKKQIDLSSKRHNLDSELSKSKKLYLKTLKDKVEVKSLTENLQKEKKIQEQSLALIEKKAAERNNAVAMLEESSRQRELIADAAQGQVSNAETLELRNQLLLYQFWYSFLNKKLQIQLDKGGILEEPFQKIKITTGMQTVEDILTRFLTREEAYKDLVMAVKRSEENLIELKSKLEDSNAHLKHLKVKEGFEKVQQDEDFIRNEERSHTNYKEMVKNYELLIQSLKEWGKEQLGAMGVTIENMEPEEILKIIYRETENLMQKIRAKAEKHQKTLSDVLYMPTQRLVKVSSFSKHFAKNRRVSPSKLTREEEDNKLLIGI